MLELKYLNVGDVLYGFKFQSAPQNIGTPGIVSNGVVDSYITIERPWSKKVAGIFHKTGVNTEKSSFKWLPWVTGQINTTTSGGKDVLSGWFSGCIMARYKDLGAWHVCHVTKMAGTLADCQNLWTNSKNGFSTVREFKPSNHITSGGLVLGLVTKDGIRFAIGLLATPSYKIDNPWKDDVDRWKIEHGNDTWGGVEPTVTKKAKEFASMKKVIVENLKQGPAYTVKSMVRVM